MEIEVENGVATRIDAHYGIQDAHPGGGRVCVKAYGLIQKTYNPDRIKTPMKRTNPKKGRGEDPGFVPISWDEALDTIAVKLKDIIHTGLTDASGYPRVAASFGGGGTPTQYMGTFPALLSAIGNVDMGFGAGQGVKCYHSEHLYGELWHRAFIVAPDTPRVNYILSCGHNGDAATGVAGIWRHADARVRGMKRVQVEPHLSVTGAVSAEWIPIKPKTDAAFLYGVLHRILCERNWRDDCDVPFLTEDTNAPYLIGPNGYFLRHVESRKPMIYDLADNTAKPFDANIKEPAMEGSYTLSGLETGADNDEWYHDNIQAKPAFQALIEHLNKYFYYKRWLWMQFPYACISKHKNYSNIIISIHKSSVDFMPITQEVEFTHQSLEIVHQARKSKDLSLENDNAIEHVLLGASALKGDSIKDWKEL